MKHDLHNASCLLLFLPAPTLKPVGEIFKKTKPEAICFPGLLSINTNAKVDDIFTAS
jgi:hypothetical protein